MIVIFGNISRKTIDTGSTLDAEKMPTEKVEKMVFRVR